MKVKSRMTPSPITITPETTHRQAVALMEQHNIRRLPVLDKKKRLIGIVSQSDLLSSAPSQATTLSMYEITSLMDKLTVDKIMTTPVIAVDENCSLAGAARIMLDNRDRKSTRLNSSHVKISYAVFCLKKKREN